MWLRQGHARNGFLRESHAHAHTTHWHATAHDVHMYGQPLLPGEESAEIPWRPGTYAALQTDLSTCLAVYTPAGSRSGSPRAQQPTDDGNAFCGPLFECGGLVGLGLVSMACVCVSIHTFSGYCVLLFFSSRPLLVWSFSFIGSCLHALPSSAPLAFVPSRNQETRKDPSRPHPFHACFHPPSIHTPS